MHRLAKAPTFAPLVLRIGIAAVILWFGANQLLNPESWTVWVPEWTAVLGLTPTTVVYLNGGFEVLAALFLIVGLFVPYVAILLFLHMCLIVFEIGLNPTGVRDIGIAVALLTLSMLTYKPKTLEEQI